MTRDQIIAKWETLSPRERDAWVEEVIFGDTGVINVGDYWFCGGNLRFPLPAYTEDIDAAWTIPSRIRGEFYLYSADRTKFVASFGYGLEECPECGEDAFEVTAQGIADTAPEAICLAAIIAKRAQAAV